MKCPECEVELEANVPRGYSDRHTHEQCIENLRSQRDRRTNQLREAVAWLVRCGHGVPPFSTDPSPTWVVDRINEALIIPWCPEDVDVSGGLVKEFLDNATDDEKALIDELVKRELVRPVEQEVGGAIPPVASTEGAFESRQARGVRPSRNTDGNVGDGLPEEPPLTSEVVSGKSDTESPSGPETPQEGITSAISELSVNHSAVGGAASELENEAIQPGGLVEEPGIHVAYARAIGIDIDAHRCDCEVCSRSAAWCPASLSSLRYEISLRARGSR